MAEKKRSAGAFFWTIRVPKLWTTYLQCREWRRGSCRTSGTNVEQRAQDRDVRMCGVTIVECAVKTRECEHGGR